MEDSTILKKPIKPVTLIALCLIVSICSGAVSGWWFSKENTFEALVIDVSKIVNDKKEELVERYRKNPTDETARAIDKELTEFLRRLDYKISDMGGNGRLVILREVVLSGETADITEEVKRFADQR